MARFLLISIPHVLCIYAEKSALLGGTENSREIAYIYKYLALFLLLKVHEAWSCVRKKNVLTSSFNNFFSYPREKNSSWSFA